MSLYVRCLLCQMLPSFKGQRFDVVCIFVGYLTQVKFNSEMQAFLTGLLCFAKIFVYKVTRNFNGVNFSSTKARTKVLGSFESQRFKLT